MQPTLWLLAGPNGSGKSTLYARMLALQAPIFVNADEIAKTLTDYPDQQSRDLAAMQMAEEERRRRLQSHQTFAAETVFSHPSKVDLIREAIAAGFAVNLVFICTDHPLINVGRVQQRVQQGGHTVDPQKVVARYQRALENLRAALPLVDRAFLYDNTIAGQDHRLVAEIAHGTVTMVVADIPSWLAQTFPEGLHAFLDQHRASMP